MLKTKTSLESMAGNILAHYPPNTFVNSPGTLIFSIVENIVHFLDNSEMSEVEELSRWLPVDISKKILTAKNLDEYYHMMGFIDTYERWKKETQKDSDGTRSANWDSEKRRVIKIIEFNTWLQSVPQRGRGSIYQYVLPFEEMPCVSHWESKGEWENFFPQIIGMRKSQQAKITRMLDYGIHEVSDIKKILNNKIDSEILSLYMNKLGNLDLAIDAVKSGLDLDMVMSIYPHSLERKLTD